MAAGLSMEIRKKQAPVRPRLCGEHWMDGDLAPWMFGDYEIREQHESVQAMLELAECLADARTEWALKFARDADNGRRSRKLELLRSPRHAATTSLTRRGFDVHRE